jgi:RHS repeat-associated protein
MRIFAIATLQDLTPSVFFHSDFAGNTIAATDANGALLWKEGYTPFGERTQIASASASHSQWFAGKQADVETGLSYFGARYYDPVVGRFMGIDAVTFHEENLQSFNRYAYGNNNPYRFVDPDGNQAVEAILPKNAPIVGMGKAIGGYVAFAEGMATGDQALRGSAADGLRESRAENIEAFGAMLGRVKGQAPKSDAVSTAAANRAESIAKGIPESAIGPSGKPKIHVVDHGGKRKQAKDAARNEQNGNGGTVENHTSPTVGKDHYHSKSQSGDKGRIHHEYNN